MSHVVEVDSVEKTIGKNTLWSDLSFSADAGEVIGITGPSGCGKSTLFNCLGLLDDFTGGEARLCGRPVKDIGWRESLKIRRERLGYLFQDFALVDNSSAAENVRIALPPGFRGRKGNRRIADALAKVGLAGRDREAVYRLSGGEQQRVAMARVLVRSPELILADEPTASLDRDNAAAILGMLQEQADLGACVLIVSHDPWVQASCQRVVSLRG